jgi:hypothetical protein
MRWGSCSRIQLAELLLAYAVVVGVGGVEEERAWALRRLPVEGVREEGLLEVG